MVSFRMAETLTALAKAFGLTRPAVAAWTRRDDWPFPKRGPWSVADVAAWRSRNLDQPRGGAASAEERAARLGVLVERTALLKLQNAVRSGELIKIADVRADWQRAVETCKARLLAIPHLVARDLAPDDPDRRRALEEGIDAAVRDVLTKLAETPKNDPS